MNPFYSPERVCSSDAIGNGSVKRTTGNTDCGVPGCLLVDLAGIEPASESLSIKASPITAASLHSLAYAAGSSLISSVASSYAHGRKA